MFTYAFCVSPRHLIRACGGLVEAGTEFEKALLEERVKLQRLFGGGDLSQFPEFSFPGIPVCVCVCLL